MRFRCPRTGQSFCPFCYEGLRGRRLWIGHLAGPLRPRLPEKGRNVHMRRRRVKEENKGQAPVYQDCEGTGLFPNLAAFIRDQQYDDGTVRETGTILLFVEDGRYKVWLHDRDTACSCFVTNTTLCNLLEAAEVALGQDNLEWRADRDPPWKKKR